MYKKKAMTDGIRKRIIQYKKSGIDIAPLIRGVIIKGENLSGTYISELQIPDENVNNTDFTNTKLKIIGNNAKLRNCRFIRAEFLPGSSLRGADCRRSNFYQAHAGFLDYSYADLRGCNICGILVSFASSLGRGAKLSENIIDLLRKWWDIDPLGEPMEDMRVE